MKNRSSQKNTQDKLPIDTIGKPLRESGVARTATVGFGMVMLALAVGFVVGLAVWALLQVSTALVNLIWGNVQSHLGWWFFPLIVCPLGGLVMGLWSKHFQSAPRPLEEVMEEVKTTGSYRIKGVIPSVVSFFMPLAFGGSVGPEAGLSGLIAAGCYFIANLLKRAGIAAKEMVEVSVPATLSAIFGTPFVGLAAAANEGESEDKASRAGEQVAGEPHESAGNQDDERSTKAATTSASLNCENSAESCIKPKNNSQEISKHDPHQQVDNYTFKPAAKITLYLAAALGAFGGIAAFSALFGASAGLPRFDSITTTGWNWLYFLPCVLVGYVQALVFHASTKGSSTLGARLEAYPVLKPVLCGLVLGVCAVFLPNVLFSGESQSHELMTTWATVGAATLLGTGFLKAAVTPFCLNMGWNGGSFFPCIFAGTTSGYGFAALTGADPLFCVVIITAVFLSATVRKPLMTVGLLLMCFPVQGVMWMSVAAVIGAAIPLPRIFQKSNEVAH